MLVQHRTAHVLSLQNMIHRNTSKKLNVKDTKKLSEVKIHTLLSDDRLVMAAQSDKAVIDFLSEQISKIEKAVLKQVQLRYPYEELITASAIGEILGITIMPETGDINRFRTVSDYSSYCRCVSSKRVSHGKKKGEGNKKNGNKQLAWEYVEAANFMRRFSPLVRSWYQRKASKTNAIVATKALSNKIARACYFIIKDQKRFDPMRLF
ncbi:MAG: transposase [Candidatus Brocadiaceae bacterium]|nr:transposase [Candidatus Brocadiaceae bacterium]